MSPTAPWLTRSAKQEKDKGHAGKKAERKVAVRLGGTLTPGSGAIASAKADVRLSVKYEFLIENKTTTGKSFSVSQDHLNKIYKEALDLGKEPALAFQFVTLQGDSKKMDRWVCIPEALYKELVS